MKSCRVAALAVFALLAMADAQAQLGVYSMVPILHDKPYIAEQVWSMTTILPDGSKRVDGAKSERMRDSVGRLREEQFATEPDANGSFRMDVVTILDPVAMQQIDLYVGEKKYLRSTIPPEVKRSRQQAILDCAREVARQEVRRASGAVLKEEYTDRQMLGVSAHGCQLTRKLPAPELQMTTEVWSSAELGINLSDVSLYANGREESHLVELLRLEEPAAGLFAIPASYTDMTAPPPRVNMNPNLDLLAESGAIEWHDGMATLTAAGANPLQQVAETLGECLAVAASTERPPQDYIGDMLDVSEPNWAAAHPDVAAHAFSPKPAKIRVDFQTNADGSAVDLASLLKEAVRQVNAQQPYSYEVREMKQRTGDSYSFVPLSTHDEGGGLVHPMPFLDTPVTIAPQKASLAALGTMVAEQVTKASGYHFDCCQAFVSGIPWGIQEIEYEAREKPAREVLADLMEAAHEKPSYMSACEARSRKYGFINVTPLSREAGARKPANGVCRIRGWDAGK